MSSRQIFIVFLVAMVSFLAKNLTVFLIFASLIEGYMLIASTDAIVTPSLFKSNYLSLYSRSDAWTMETHE